MTLASAGDLARQLRLDGVDEEETYLASLLTAAEGSLLAAANRDSTDGLSEAGLAAFRHAELMLASYWYGQREAASAGQQSAVPFGIAYLILPYKRYAVGES